MSKRLRVDDDRAEILKDPHNQAIVERKRRKIREKKLEETADDVAEKCNYFDQEASLSFKKFDNFPLSQKTLKGLKKAGFSIPTEIQQKTLGYALSGQDVVGAAKTGSGKTLALIIPLLECLFRNRWSSSDGLGALVIAPTRELSYQIYQVLNTVGAFHNFSAALLIGGTNVEYEKKRLASMNIIICTPGRLLQHMDENENFLCDQLQILIIDEADRILDLGFRKQMDSIIENLPKERQTLLFSATQTKKTDDLARVSLKENAAFVSIHENADSATPDKLEQFYFVCEDHEKVNMFWAFLKNHKRKKSLIFVTCCKQARFLTESFCHLRPGLSVMGLWGDMSQNKRIDIFHKFDQSGRGAAMIATDVASRGLDFQNVDWVLQLDCPADVNDYIHRVGRTARLNNRGKAMLVLTPSQEKPFVELMAERRIPISKVEVDTQKVVDIHTKLSNLMIPFPNVREFAQACFVSYAKAIFFMKLKSVFDIHSINFEELAKSYGLPVTPRIRFLRKHGLDPTKKRHDFVPPIAKKSKKEKVEEVVITCGDENLSGGGKVTVEKGKEDVDDGANNEEKDDGFLTVSRRDVFNVLSGATVEDEIDARVLNKEEKVMTKTEFAKKILKRGIKLNKQIRF